MSSPGFVSAASEDWKLASRCLPSIGSCGAVLPQRGWQPSAQGWRVFEPTLGKVAREKFNPEGVAAREKFARGFNPFRVEIRGRRFLFALRSQGSPIRIGQPWAGGLAPRWGGEIANNFLEIEIISTSAPASHARPCRRRVFCRLSTVIPNCPAVSDRTGLQRGVRQRASGGCV